MPRKRPEGNGLPMQTEVNVTSLVDVAFTLLVIFIITAPILQGGIDVDVPEAAVPPITQADDPIYITLERNGTVYIEETALTIAEFEETFPQIAEARGFERVYFRGDSTASYGAAAKILATLATSGIDFAMVSQPYGPNR